MAQSMQHRHWKRIGNGNREETAQTLPSPPRSVLVFEKRRSVKALFLKRAQRWIRGFCVRGRRKVAKTLVDGSMDGWMDGVSGRVNETAGDSRPPLPSLPSPPSLDRLEPFEREQLRLLDEVMVRACLRIVEFYIDRARGVVSPSSPSSSSSPLLHILFRVTEQGDGAKL